MLEQSQPGQSHCHDGDSAMGRGSIYDYRVNYIVFFPPQGFIDFITDPYFAVPFTVFIVAHILLKVVPNKNNTVYNRRTGMVTLPTRKGLMTLPFAEFDAYHHRITLTASVRYSLYLGHRFQPVGMGTSTNWNRLYWVYSQWEWIQQYMDTSMPLPDLPELEPYRHLDPTTAAWDKAHKRPPHYWRDMDIETFKKKHKAGIKAVENFPWNTLPPNPVPQECMDKVPRMAQWTS